MASGTPFRTFLASALFWLYRPIAALPIYFHWYNVLFETISMNFIPYLRNSTSFSQVSLAEPSFTILLVASSLHYMACTIQHCILSIRVKRDTKRRRQIFYLWDRHNGQIGLKRFSDMKANGPSNTLAETAHACLALFGSSLQYSRRRGFEGLNYLF